MGINSLILRLSETYMDLLPDTLNCRLRMRQECRERFSPPPISKQTASKRPRHASRHVRDARAVMHVGIAYLRWRGKRSRHSRRMRTRNVAYLARGPCINKQGHHWFRQWLVPGPLPSHYLNQCWLTVNWTLGNKFQTIFIQENESQSAVCKMVVILSQPQWVNRNSKFN